MYIYQVALIYFPMLVPTYYTVQVVDSALSSIFNQIDAATAVAPPPPQHVAKEEEEEVPKNRHDLVTVAPQTLVQQPAEERRHHRPLRRQASLSKSAGALVKTTGLKQNGTVALGQRGVLDASVAAGTIPPLADDTASKIEKSAVVPVLNKKTQERRQHQREGTTTGHKFIVKSLASEDSKYITVSTDAAATDETKDPKKDLQHGEEAKNAKTEKTSSKDSNGYFGTWSGGLFSNTAKEQRSNGDTTFHVYSAVEAETDKIQVV